MRVNNNISSSESYGREGRIIIRVIYIIYRGNNYILYI